MADGVALGEGALSLAANAITRLNESVAAGSTALDGVEDALGQVDDILEQYLVALQGVEFVAGRHAPTEWEQVSRALLKFVGNTDGFQQARGLATVAVLVRVAVGMKMPRVAANDVGSVCGGLEKLMNGVACHCDLNLRVCMDHLQRAVNRSELGSPPEVGDEVLMSAQAAAASLDALFEGAMALLPASFSEGELQHGEYSVVGGCRPLASIVEFLTGCICCLNVSLSAGSISKTLQVLSLHPLPPQQDHHLSVPRRRSLSRSFEYLLAL